MKTATPLNEAIIYRYSTLIILLIPALLYLNSLRLGFVYFDDDILILTNYEKINNLSNVGKAFQSDAFFANLSPYYRPLQTVSFMVDAAIGGKSPAVYHAANTIYHILACLSLSWLLSMLGFSKSKALLGTIIFSVHPVIGQAVLWIPARGDLLVSLFGILSFGLFMKYLKDKKILYLMLHLVCLACAFFSKESAVILPGLFLLYLFLTRGLSLDMRIFTLAGAWIFLLLAWYYLRSVSIEHLGDSQLGFHALISNLPFIPEVVSRIFLPFNLPVTPVFTTALTIAGIVIILLLIIVIYLYHERSSIPLILFGTTWFISFCLPNMFVRFDSSNDSFEYLLHRTYLPSVGFLIMALSAIPSKWYYLHRKPSLLLSVGLVLFFSILSFSQQNNYRDGIHFWGSAINYKPDRAWFHYYMGRYYFKQKDNEQYEKYLLAAEKLKSYPEFKYQLGMISFVDKKDYESAYSYFSHAFQQGYSDPDARTNFTLLCLESSAEYFRKGDYPNAVKRCEEAVVNDPANADAAYNLGIYLVNSGDKQRAASMWKQAIRLKPDLASAYRSLCLYYQYDAKKADSANWYARAYNLLGGTENLISP